MLLAAEVLLLAEHLGAALYAPLTVCHAPQAQTTMHRRPRLRLSRYLVYLVSRIVPLA